MKILVDENIPRMTVEGLRTQGHDVKDIRGTAQQAVPDSALWQIASLEDRLLITTDKGLYGVQRHTMAFWWCAYVSRTGIKSTAL
jgi:predicted nuclease of predicted toxin-antitoxin system